MTNLLIALRSACDNGHLEIVKLLLHGKRVNMDVIDQVIICHINFINFKKEGNNLLHLSSRKNDIRIVDILVKLGVSPLAINKQGKKPLDLTSKREIVKLLEGILDH